MGIASRVLAEQILVAESARLGVTLGSRGHGGKEGLDAFRALSSLWSGET